VVVRRFDICLVNLDPTVGSEIKKTRPCLLISPDEMNRSVAGAAAGAQTRSGACGRRLVDVSRGDLVDR